MDHPFAGGIGSGHRRGCLFLQMGTSPPGCRRKYRPYRTISSEGAFTFLKREYRILGIFVIIVSILVLLIFLLLYGRVKSAIIFWLLFPILLVQFYRVCRLCRNKYCYSGNVRSASAQKASLLPIWQVFAAVPLWVWQLLVLPWLLLPYYSY